MISVVIPTYNRAQFLRCALDSVFSQTFRDYEIIVVDDGSTDSTRNIVQVYGQQIRYIYQKNQGRGEARNTGIREAKGDFIAFLDSDDIWYSNHLERHVQYLNKIPNAEFIHGEIDVINIDGLRDIKESNKLKVLYRNAAKKGFNYVNLLRSCLIFSSTVLVKRSLFSRCGGFDPQLRLLEDIDWYLRVARSTPIHYLGECSLASYRNHNGNAFRTDNNLVLEMYAKIFKKNLLELERSKVNFLAICEANLSLSFCYLGLGRPLLSRKHIVNAIITSPIYASRPEVLWRLIRTFLVVNKKKS